MRIKSVSVVLEWSVSRRNAGGQYSTSNQAVLPGHLRPGWSPPALWLLAALLPLWCSPVHGQGALTNGWAPTGTIAPAGDFDTWTFSANTGDRLVIRVGEISQTGSFTPRIRLQNPSAVQIASAQGALAAEIAVTATNTGTFTLIADDAVGTSATGTYRLSLAKAPGTVFLTPGDEGGPMTNAFQHTGTNLVGDLDLWTFSANAGDAIVLRMGAAAYNPWIRLYGPDGVLVGQAFDGSFGIRDADLRTQATNSGTFTVIAGSLDVIASGSYI
ncbi:MAG TPA: hypothetical protein P5205_02565, partial [Candidatus Paceibacterota bacterium]|nr:hypothetical protein [Verrucomicrobiota bacterium]HSA09230.1 hypothetical protein [Candidatus Paceibacterota bacterium]